MKRTESNDQGGFGMLPIFFLFLAVFPVLFAAVAGEIWSNTHQQPSDRAQITLEQRMSNVADELAAALSQARQTSLNVRSQVLSELGDPELSEWFVPFEGDESGYEHIRFSTPDPARRAPGYNYDIEHVVRFVRDEGEQLNGRDDDGDGAVDEGRLELRKGTGEFRVLASDVKACEFSIRGWQIHFSIEAERLLDSGRFAYARVSRAIAFQNL